MSRTSHLIRQQILGGASPLAEVSLRFLILYPDGSRDKVTTDQKQEMLRDGIIEAIDTNRYRYTGKSFHFSSLADLSLFKGVITSTYRLANYPGLFIWEHENKQHKELLEPPEKMARRLKAAGAVK